MRRAQRRSRSAAHHLLFLPPICTCDGHPARGAASCSQVMFIADAMESLSTPSGAPSANDQDSASPDNRESLDGTPGCSPRSSVATPAQRGLSISSRPGQSPLAAVSAKDDGTAGDGVGAGHLTGRRLSGPEDPGLPSAVTRASSTLPGSKVGGSGSSEQHSRTHALAGNTSSRDSGGSFPGEGLPRRGENEGGATSANDAGYGARDEKQSSSLHRPIISPRRIDTGVALRSPENVTRSPGAFVRLVRVAT